MNDAEYEAQVARMKACYETFTRVLGFGDWTVNLYYHRDPSTMPMQPGKKLAAEGGAIGMTAFSQWHYRQVGVNVNMQCIATLDDYHLNRLFIHELMHAVIDETAKGGKHEERVVTWLSDIVLWAIEYGAEQTREGKTLPAGRQLDE